MPADPMHERFRALRVEKPSQLTRRVLWVGSLGAIGFLKSCGSVDMGTPGIGRSVISRGFLAGSPAGRVSMLSYCPHSHGSRWVP